MEPFNRNGGNPDVNFNFVCKIDRELYRVVSGDIQTDDVIITAQQIAHIEEGHPGAYVQFMQYLPRVLRDPDFILRGNKPHTALVRSEERRVGRENRSR